LDIQRLHAPLYHLFQLHKGTLTILYFPTRRNTAIIALGAAASIATSIAGYFFAPAAKYYHLTNTTLRTAKSSFEHQADLNGRQDEELLLDAASQYHINETQIVDFVVGLPTQEDKDIIEFNRQSSTFSLTPTYYEFIYSDYFNPTQAEHIYLDHVGRAGAYSHNS